MLIAAGDDGTDGTLFFPIKATYKKECMTALETEQLQHPLWCETNGSKGTGAFGGARFLCVSCPDFRSYPCPCK